MTENKDSLTVLANKLFNSETGQAFLVELAKELGVNQSTCSPVIKGKTYPLTDTQILQRAAVLDAYHAIIARLHPSIKAKIAHLIY